MKKANRLLVLFLIVLLSFSIAFLSFSLLKEEKNFIGSINKNNSSNNATSEGNNSGSKDDVIMGSVSYTDWPGWEQFESNQGESWYSKLPTLTSTSFSYGIQTADGYHHDGIEFHFSMSLRSDLYIWETVPWGESQTKEVMVPNPEFKHGCIVAPLDCFGSIIEANEGLVPDDWIVSFEALHDAKYFNMIAASNDIIVDEEEWYLAYSCHFSDADIGYENINSLYSAVPYTIDPNGIITYGSVLNLRKNACSYSGVCSKRLVSADMYPMFNEQQEDVECDAATKVLSDSIYLWAGFSEPGEELQYYEADWNFTSITLTKGEEKEVGIKIVAGFPDMFFGYKSDSPNIVKVGDSATSVKVTLDGSNEIYNSVLLKASEVGTSLITVYYCGNAFTFSVTVVE